VLCHSGVIVRDKGVQEMVEVLFVILVIVIAFFVRGGALKLEVTILQELLWKELFRRDMIHRKSHWIILDRPIYLLSTQIADTIRLLGHVSVLRLKLLTIDNHT
jgi:hypothetical protein